MANHGSPLSFKSRNLIYLVLKLVVVLALIVPYLVLKVIKLALGILSWVPLVGLIFRLLGVVFGILLAAVTFVLCLPDAFFGR